MVVRQDNNALREIGGGFPFFRNLFPLSIELKQSFINPPSHELKTDPLTLLLRASGISIILSQRSGPIHLSNYQFLYSTKGERAITLVRIRRVAATRKTEGYGLRVPYLLGLLWVPSHTPIMSTEEAIYMAGEGEGESTSSA